MASYRNVVASLEVAHADVIPNLGAVRVLSMEELVFVQGAFRVKEILADRPEAQQHRGVCVVLGKCVAEVVE